MIYAEKVCKLPICGKRSGKYDIMLHDLVRVLAPDDSCFLWIRPDIEQIPYGSKTYGAQFDKPKQPHVTIPANVSFVYPCEHTTYRALRRSIEASIVRLELPLKIHTQGKRPVITRLPDP